MAQLNNRQAGRAGNSLNPGLVWKMVSEQRGMALKGHQSLNFYDKSFEFPRLFGSITGWLIRDYHGGNPLSVYKQLVNTQENTEPSWIAEKLITTGAGFLQDRRLTCNLGPCLACNRNELYLLQSAVK